jgi:spore maturation protein CgeE
MNLKAIIDFEIKYVLMFCESIKSKHGYIYYDNLQRDKYYHNYMHILNPSFMTQRILKKYKDQFSHFGHLNYRCEFEPNLKDFLFLEPYSMQKDGYYTASIDSISINRNETIDVKMIDPSMKDIFLAYSFLENKIYGEDYAKNNAIRQWNVMMENDHYRYFLAFMDEQIVGCINAMWIKDQAKIDDFSVLPSYQRKGVGSQLMIKVLETLKEKGVSEVYLVTELDDTPKLMYQKWGFQYVGEFSHMLKVFPNKNEDKA